MNCEYQCIIGMLDIHVSMTSQAVSETKFAIHDSICNIWCYIWTEIQMKSYWNEAIFGEKVWLYKI